MGRKRIVLLSIILAFCCAAFCVTAFAASCSLRITIRYQDQPVEDLRVELCQVTAQQDGSHTLTTGFANLNVPVEDLLMLSMETAAQVRDYALEMQVQSVQKVTDADGIVDYNPLAEGVYLVFAGEGQPVKFHPYLVMLPGIMPDALVYDVYSAPKSVTGNMKSLPVAKQWEDQDNQAGLRPESLQITLYQDGEEIRRVSLNEECGWQHVFEDLPVGSVYTVTENDVPGYTGKVEETEAGLVLTNTYTQSPPADPDDPDLPVKPDWKDPVPPEKPDPPQEPEVPPEPDVPTIPQAGFRMWPVYGMLIVGFAMVVFGLSDLYLGREEVYKERCEEE